MWEDEQIFHAITVSLSPYCYACSQSKEMDTQVSFHFKKMKQNSFSLCSAFFFFLNTIIAWMDIGETGNPRTHDRKKETDCFIGNTLRKYLNCYVYKHKDIPAWRSGRRTTHLREEPTNLPRVCILLYTQREMGDTQKEVGGGFLNRVPSRKCVAHAYKNDFFFFFLKQFKISRPSTRVCVLVVV